MSVKKYEFTSEVCLYNPALRRIRRISDGALGGFIEFESNLSHDGTAWVSGDAMVSGNARVSGDAMVSGNAVVYGNAMVYGGAWVSGNAEVSGNARVSGDAEVSGNAVVSGRCFNLIWADYNITISDNILQIGCESIPIGSTVHHDLQALAIKRGFDPIRAAAFIQVIEGMLLLKSIQG